MDDRQVKMHEVQRRRRLKHGCRHEMHAAAQACAKWKQEMSLHSFLFYFLVIELNPGELGWKQDSVRYLKINKLEIAPECRKTATQLIILLLSQAFFSHL